MFRPLRYLRRHVYPRSQLTRLAGSGTLRGSDAMLGMMLVVLVLVGVASVLEMALF